MRVHDRVHDGFSHQRGTDEGKEFQSAPCMTLARSTW